MAYDFPASPSVGTLFAPAGGPTWQWNGTAWTNVSPANLVPEAPQDGQNYVRRNGVWVLAPGTAEAKNRIVNGAMQISQENGDTTGSIASAVYYPVDQWWGNASIATTSIGRAGVSSNSPYGRSIGTGVATAKPSLAAGDYWQFCSDIEGIRMADFGWGAAGAKQVVLRFYAYSNMAGTYAVKLVNGAANRTFLAPFTIAVAGVWELKTIVIPGDVTGTWAIDTAKGARLSFIAAAGSNYVSAGVQGWQAGDQYGFAGMSNGAATVNVFFFSGVGLHLDPQNTGIAPPWQMPDEAEELRACMRYYERHTIVATNIGLSLGYPANQMGWKVTKRIFPALSATFDSGSGATYLTSGGSTGTQSFHQSAAHNALATATVTGNARM